MTTALTHVWEKRPQEVSLPTVQESQTSCQ